MVYPPYTLTLTIFIYSFQSRARSALGQTAPLNAVVWEQAISRNAKWDYDQTRGFEIGTAKQPDLFRININTKGNTLSQEDFAKLEANLMKVITKFSLGDKLLASSRPIYDADSGVDTDW